MVTLCNARNENGKALLKDWLDLGCPLGARLTVSSLKENHGARCLSNRYATLAFSVRITGLAGEPAMHYVARWNIQAALARPRENGFIVGGIGKLPWIPLRRRLQPCIQANHGVAPGAARTLAETAGAQARARSRLRCMTPQP